MKVTLLHTKDALEPPVDPVLDQIEDALRSSGHETRRIVVDDDIEPVIAALKADKPDLVFNIAESFGGKSALESNVAALLNLLQLRYTGSSPAGLIVAGDKTLTKKVLTFHGILTARFATVFRGDVDWAGDIEFPLILKPPQEDASLGITQKSIVNDVQELLETISSLQTEYQSRCSPKSSSTAASSTSECSATATSQALPDHGAGLFRSSRSGLPKIASWEAKWGDDGEGKGAEFEGHEVDVPDRSSEELAEADAEGGDRCIPGAAASRLRARGSAGERERGRSTSSR